MPVDKPNATGLAHPDSDSCCVPQRSGSLNREDKGAERKKEIGGRDGPDPTRFGDWEKNGRCIDF